MWPSKIIRNISFQFYTCVLYYLKNKTQSWRVSKLAMIYPIFPVTFMWIDTQIFFKYYIQILFSVCITKWKSVVNPAEKSLGWKRLFFVITIVIIILFIAITIIIFVIFIIINLIIIIFIISLSFSFCLHWFKYILHT